MLSPKWLTIHAVAVCLVVLFIALGLWQVHRAESGNTASYGYALEWPTFALLVVGFWVKVVREEVRHGRSAAPGDQSPDRGGRPVHGDLDSTLSAGDEQAAELAAYNRYVAERARLRTSG